MGTRGPAKKPAAAHKRAGTYRKDRHASPALPTKAPPMPAGLPRAAADAWKRIVPTLDRAGYLAEVDAEALRMLCEAIADYEKAGAAITKYGLLVKHWNTAGSQVLKANPACTIRRDARAAIISLAQKFGMTPSGRTGLGEKDDDSLPPELAAVLGVHLN
jgi:P27 family predicted phage terminase small subunit